MELENKDTDVVTVEAEEVQEESPLLVAQRYLNIFRQIHIFKAAKKAQFDNELLNLPEKIKRYLIDLPAGSILLEHILELEEQNNYDTQLTKSLLMQKKKKSDYSNSNDSLHQTLAPTSGELTLGSDFATVLAKSLAAALGNSGVQPQLLGNNSGTVAPFSTPNGKNIASQTNVAASTVNNIHLDNSVFQNLADAINKTNAQTHDDFMKVVETLNQNYNPTIVKTDGIPLNTITSSIAQILKETSRQQIEEMKMFSQTLTDAILNSNRAPQPVVYDNIQVTRPDNSFPPANKEKLTSKQKSSTTDTQNSDSAQNNDTQTISVINRTINPLTSQSTVEKNSYSIPVKTAQQNVFSTPKPAKKQHDPLLQAQNVMARTSLNVKPVSLSAQDTTSPFTQPQPRPQTPPAPQPQPQPSYTEYDLSEGFVAKQNSEPQEDYGDDEWEYVDEYGNPITDNGEDGEWEYVDEYGNPITDDGEDGEWEYVEDTELAPENEAIVNTQPQATDNAEEKSKKIDLKAVIGDKLSETAASLSEMIKDDKVQKSGNIFSSLFKKKSQQENDKPAKTPKDETKDKPAPTDEPKKDSADDILASAFGGKTSETPKEETKDKPASNDEPKKDSVDDILASAFGGKTSETTKEEKKDKPAPIDEPKKDSVDDILASAFGGKTSETPKDTPKPKMGGILAEAFKESEKETKSSGTGLFSKMFKGNSQTEEKLSNNSSQSKNISSEDILASAFSGKTSETPKEAPKPKIGGILAEAFKAEGAKIEKDKKALSSKDMLAEAFKAKTQPAEDTANSLSEEPEELSTAVKISSSDILAETAGTNKNSKHDADFEALLKAFTS